MVRTAKGKTLAELSAETGIPARTIRFYIARGLVPGPVSAGRGALYAEEHAARLQAITKLKAKGLMLGEIALALAGDGAPRPLPVPAAWWTYSIADDVVVSVRAGATPWRLRQVQSALLQMAASLQKASPEREDENASDK